MTIPTNLSVDPVLDPIDKDYKPSSPYDEEVQSQYIPTEFTSAPITVQLACRRFREEECIGLAGIISEVIKT